MPSRALLYGAGAVACGIASFVTYSLEGSRLAAASTASASRVATSAPGAPGDVAAPPSNTRSRTRTRSTVPLSAAKNGP